MKRTYFIKFDPRIKRFTGCDRATLILEKIEFFFSRQPNGFYKFIEPCAHKLYRKLDSWSEELGCDRKSFTRAWEKIAFRHKSRRAFNEAKDKFEGRLYASFYDRNRNQMFFIRNHELANETLKEFYKPKKSKIKKEDAQAKKTTNSLACNPLRNGHNGRSYKDVKNTPSELSEDNSHAGKDIIKKLIEIWTAIVQEGNSQIDLEGNIIPFLKKAFKDKFNSCLQKWKDYCTNIASSKYLMGEKISWKANLEWALKFESIRKVLSGNYYGIGDRTPKAILPSQAELQKEILTCKETQEAKDFRILCLEKVGVAIYNSQFRNLAIELRGEREIALIAAHKFGADFIDKNYYSYLQVILQNLGESVTKITILALGETKGRLIEWDRRGKALPDQTLVSSVEQSNLADFSLKGAALQDELLPEVSLEAQELRERLKTVIPSESFPNWLANIEIEGISKEGMVIVSVEGQPNVEYCRNHFRQQILASSKGLWHNVKYLIIQERSEVLKDFNPVSFQYMAQEKQNFPDFKSLEDDAEFLLNMHESVGEDAAFKKKLSPKISKETESLRAQLRYIIPSKQFPGWLGNIEVENIKQDGTVVVAFEDELAVNYCKVRFSHEIFQAAKSLWENVNKVLVCHKIEDSTCSFTSTLSKSSEQLKEKSKFEQAVQSLLSACSPNLTEAAAI